MILIPLTLQRAQRRHPRKRMLKTPLMYSSMEVIIFLRHYDIIVLAKALDLTIDSNLKDGSEKGG
jgi:hypothetical protein